MDVGAFTELVRKHQAAVAAVAYAIVRDRALAFDLTQEAFVIAWRRIDEVREPERTGAWLCGIVRFLARDHRRVERRRQTLRERHVDAAPAAPPTPTPLDQALAREDDALLAAVVAELPDSQREPLLLHYVANLSISEIAQTLALAEDAVKQRLSRARAALRDEPRFAAAALALAPLPSFSDATVTAATSAATSAPPVPTQESFMSSHPILTVSLLAGALAAGGLAVAATRGDDPSTTSRMRDTNAADSAVPAVVPPSPGAPAIARPRADRAALLEQIRAARARKSTIMATGGGTGASPPPTRPMIYDFSGETLTAGIVPQTAHRPRQVRDPRLARRRARRRPRLLRVRPHSLTLARRHAHRPHRHRGRARHRRHDQRRLDPRRCIDHHRRDPLDLRPRRDRVHRSPRA
jgi:RNA polymerase sigma factor (sigma-70 family)